MIAGKYLVQERLGGGAMGEVYRARQTALDRDVAVKVIHPHLARDPAFSERFQREALATTRFSHPNSIAVTDYGEEPDGLLYLVMEFVPGKSLELLVEDQGQLSEARAVEILSQVLAALAAAHDMGIVHRDLKPENILVFDRLDDDGRESVLVKVCDFGIASIVGDAPRTGSHSRIGRSDPPSGPRITNVGTVLGTPAYMSPEQARGEAATTRSDVYSAGIVLYQMLAGRLPFEGADVTATVLLHITKKPTPPRIFRPALNPALEQVCLQALEKSPDQRFPSARAMRAALRDAAGGDRTSSLAPPAVAAAPAAASKLRDLRAAETLVGTVQPPQRGRRRAWLVLAVATVLGGAGALAITARVNGLATAAAGTPQEVARDATVRNRYLGRGFEAQETHHA
jgi:serine/threonine-protein kinase